MFEQVVFLLSLFSYNPRARIFCPKGDPQTNNNAHITGGAVGSTGISSFKAFNPTCSRRTATSTAIERRTRNRGYLLILIIKKSKGSRAEREAQGAQGLNKNCEESMSPSSRLIRGFRYKNS